MEEIIDQEYLLRPLSDPAENPRIERFDIRSKRQAEFDRAEQYQNFVEYGSEFGEAQSPDPPDWSNLRRACEQHLANKAKDLWVCAWYVESLLIEYGFRGLAEGFQFMTAFIEAHWENIEPSPNDEDGIEATVKMIAGLNNGATFIDQLRMTPITVESGENPPLTCATIDETDGNVRSQLVGNTDQEFFDGLARNILDSGSAFDQLCDVLKEKCGDDAPPSAKIRDALQGCESKIREIYPQAFAIAEEATEGTGEDGESNEVSTIGGDSQANMATASHVQNREEAFRMLETVSNFFRDNEPQSPVSYLLEKAVRWGRMALPDLIAEMVDDDDTKSQIFRLAGIKKEEDYDD